MSLNFCIFYHRLWTTDVRSEQTQEAFLKQHQVTVIDTVGNLPLRQGTARI